MSSRVQTCPACQAKNRVPAVGTGVPQCARCHTKLPWVVDATEANFDDAVNTTAVVVIDLWAAWCGPCRMVAPLLDQLAVAHAGHLKVVKVDVDANPALASRFSAQSIPLLVVMTDGEVRERLLGAQPLSVLQATVRPYLPAA